MFTNKTFYIIIIMSFTALLSASPATIPEKETGENRDKSQPKKTRITPDHTSPAFIRIVEEALTALKNESPQVHQDALNVWKKFESRSKTINFTYRFWGRHLISYLQEEKNVLFDSEEKVGEVFKVLWKKKLISKNAVVVLMVDCWSHLVYLEGSPGWEHRLENRTPEGGETPTAKINNPSYDRSI
jgi:hypothetical protein